MRSIQIPKLSGELFRGIYVGGILANALKANENFLDGDMRRKEKITIVTIEARERTTIRHGMPPGLAWCERCGAEVLMITPNEAAALAQTDARSIFRGVEAGAIHFIESAEGALLVCSKSLTCAP